MSTQPATISATAIEHRFHLHWLWIALAIAVAVVAITFAVLALTAGGSDAGPVGSDTYLCPRMGSPC